jgi:hypothetical protein
MITHFETGSMLASALANGNLKEDSLLFGFHDAHGRNPAVPKREFPIACRRPLPPERGNR